MELQNTTTAYFAANIMNLFGKSLKSAMTVEKLLKPLLGNRNAPTDRKADEEYLKQKFKGKI